MPVAFIRGVFVVSSHSNKKKDYFIGKDLKCSCKGYFAHNHCRHQAEVMKFIEKGGTVDMVRVPIDYDYGDEYVATEVYR